VHPVWFVVGVALIVTVLWDAFETVVLPRTVTRRFGVARIYFRGTWKLWGLARIFDSEGRRERFLAVYGPVSLLGLLAVWAAGLIGGFGGLRPLRSADADARLLEMRRSYEPFVVGLGRLLMMPMPPWRRPNPMKDNWQTSPRRDDGPHL
jgi:hypothetical protein